jgi:hypothetical protein
MLLTASRLSREGNAERTSSRVACGETVAHRAGRRKPLPPLKALAIFAAAAARVRGPGFLVSSRWTSVA